jgi:hypothetical protein
VVFVVPPDKSTIYPEYLPPEYPDKACAGPGRKELWDAIEGSTRRELLGLRKPMLAVKEAPPEHTYLVNDTHWGSKGAVLALAAVLERLPGSVAVADEEIERGRGKVAGDLSGLLGAPQELDAPVWRIKRAVADVTSREEKLPEGSVEQVWTRPAGRAPLIPGRTVFVYDSFGVGLLDNLGAYTRELASLQWYSTKPNDTIEAIARADTVILEKVERDLNFLASDQGIVTPANLDALEARLDAGH